LADGRQNNYGLQNQLHLEFTSTRVFPQIAKVSVVSREWFGACFIAGTGKPLLADGGKNHE
jgi:hypothetical protein